MEPVKSVNRDERTGEHYYTCPVCGQWVGGYVITGSSFEDWSYEQNKFCRNCGTKINWGK